MYNNVHSNLVNNNELERPSPSTTNEKYITMCSCNGILCHNTDESQEKNVDGKKQITLKKCPQ